jgi:hypothetical protein
MISDKGARAVSGAFATNVSMQAKMEEREREREREGRMRTVNQLKTLKAFRPVLTFAKLANKEYKGHYLSPVEFNLIIHLTNLDIC